MYNDYVKLINIDIENCFLNISHKAILAKVPLTEKYRFLLKAWLTAPTVDDKNKTILIATKGVPQGSILGSICSNFVLDGFQNYIKSYENKSSLIKSKSQLEFIKVPIRKNNLLYDIRNPRANVYALRFADDIMIGRALVRNQRSLK